MRTNNIPFPNMKKEIILNYPKSAAWILSKGPKNEFEAAVVNEPSVSEPWKFYCIFIIRRLNLIYLSQHAPKGALLTGQ